MPTVRLDSNGWARGILEPLQLEEVHVEMEHLCREGIAREVVQVVAEVEDRPGSGAPPYPVA